MRGFMHKSMEYIITVCASFIAYNALFYVLNKDFVNYKDLWKIFLVLAIVCLILIILMNRMIKFFSRLRYLRSPLSRIDKMKGIEFEEYLKAVFEKKGYKVEITPRSNDYGADLVCVGKGETVVVQAKRYEGNVGNSAIQEVVAAREYYDADRCIVVTNSYFTKNAVKLAEANDVELWDRNEL